MMEHRRCPDCDSTDTERVHTEWHTDMLEEIRICNDCPTQFTNRYDLFAQDTDEVPA